EEADPALPLWPGPAVTDERGRFTLRGLGRDLSARLEVRDRRFGRQQFQLEKDGQDGSREIVWSLEPGKVLDVRVTAADTGKPVPRARVLILAYRGSPLESPTLDTEEGVADGRGRFRCPLPPGDHYTVAAYPPEGEPYLLGRRGLQWPKGT